MGYCFLRVDKIKTNADFVRKYEHNYRTEQVPNAIPELKDQNQELVKLQGADGTPCDYLTAYKSRIRELDFYKSRKVRKDNVKGLEICTTFSKESKEHIDLEKWKEENVKWLREYFNRCPEKYGDNVISVMYHGDECGNVHCHSIVIPIDEEGKLSADKYLGGRSKMREMQDSYGRAMSSLGLERGLKGSSARHQDITKFYAKLNKRMEIPEPEHAESAEAYRSRILELVQTERADSLRKVLEMDRALRRKRDIHMQQSFEKERDEIQKMAASMEAEIQNKKDYSSELDRIIEDKQDEIQKQDAILRSKKQEIREITDRCLDLKDKMGQIKDVERDLKEYRHREEIIHYARDNGYGSLVDEMEQTLFTLEDIYDRSELENEYQHER